LRELGWLMDRHHEREHFELLKLAALRSSIANAFGGSSKPSDFMPHKTSREDPAEDEVARKLMNFGRMYGTVRTRE